MKIGNQSLRVEGASSPEDIYWFNMKVSDAKRRSY
jgi:hypothetical protein